MTVIADKVLVLFLEDGGGDSDAALDAVAARGCCGTLVLPAGASPLDNLLGVARGAGGAESRLKFPKMPLALFSTQPSARALAQSLGVAQVADADAPEAEAEARALLAADGKQLVFVHATALATAQWTRALVRELIEKSSDGGDAARCLVAVVRSAQLPHQPPTDASAFRPRQSLEKVDGEYLEAAAESAALCRLLLAFYQADRTRCDHVQTLDEAQIDALGGYGAMSALMFAQEVAFRLGFAPKYGASRATAYEDSDSDADSAMYQSVSETEPMLAHGGKHPPDGAAAAGTGSVRSMRLEAPPPHCNDGLFAALFLVNVGAIAVFAFAKGVPALAKSLRPQPTPTPDDPDDFSHVFVLAAALAGVAVALSLAWMKLLMAYAASMIRIALWFNVGLTVVFALTTFAVSPLMACLFLLMAGLNVWYIFAVQDRIGFASANLKAACAAVADHSSIFLVAFLLLLKQTIWLVLWSLSAVGIYQMLKDADPGCEKLNANGRPERLCGGVGGGFVLFFMLISVYWGQQVLQNILTCTTSGVVASWWYQPNAKKATSGALYRSLTSSFGSICFGSLIVAVLQALRTMATILKQKARDDDNGALACVACLAECILNCLEGIMEYINQWAYVYVGIYGYDFRTSGKAVMDLFANRGWTAVINDDLTSSALTLGALGVGVVTCIIGLLVAKFCPQSWFTALGTTNTAYGVLGTIGFIAGMSMAMILANVVITALHTVFVCFAEDPIAFSRNHPREYEDLVGGWRKFHGEELVSAYGSAV